MSEDTTIIADCKSTNPIPDKVVDRVGKKFETSIGLIPTGEKKVFMSLL